MTKENIMLDHEDEREMYFFPITCSRCKHFDFKDLDEKICPAFPDGIPADIWCGRNDHTSPVEGDHGIQYEARANIEKAKKYLKHDQKAPAGYREQRGPKGGRYYDTKPGDKDGQRRTDEPASLKSMGYVERNRKITEMLKDQERWTKRPELDCLKGLKVGFGLKIPGGSEIPNHYVWYPNSEGIMVPMPPDVVRSKMDEEERQEKIKSDPGIKKFTTDEINAIFAIPPKYQRQRPELHYLDGTELGPGITVNGRDMSPDAVWYVSRYGHLAIDTAGSADAIHREFDRLCQARDAAQDAYKRGKERGRPDEFVPYRRDIEEIVYQEHQDICGHDYETAVLIHPDGEVAWSKVGEAHQVLFEEPEIAQFQGAILLHNHPSSSPFSEPDIKLACQFRLREIRVSTREGHEYLMLPPEGKPTFWPELWDDIARGIVAAEENLHPDIDPRYLSGEITSQEAVHEMTDRTWKQVAHTVGIRYKKHQADPRDRRPGDHYQTEIPR